MKKYFYLIAIFILLSISARAQSSTFIVKPDTLDFGTMQIGKDIYKAGNVIVLNNTSQRHVLKDSAFILNDGNTFSLRSSLPIEFSASQGKSIEIRCQPTVFTPGIRIGVLKLFNKDTSNLFTYIIMKVEILAKDTIAGNFQISIPDIKAKVGEQFTMPLLLDSFSREQFINGFSCKIKFDASMMTPVNVSERGNIEYGMHTLTIQKDISSNTFGHDTLFKIDMIAGLGSSSSTPIIIDDFTWSTYGKILISKTTTKQGSLTLTDVFNDGGTPRLITEKTDVIDLVILGEVFNTDFDVTLTYNSSAILQIFDLNGVQVIPQITLPVHTIKGPEIYNIKRNIFAKSGIYFIRLSDKNHTKTQKIVVN